MKTMEISMNTMDKRFVGSKMQQINRQIARKSGPIYWLKRERFGAMGIEIFPIQCWTQELRMESLHMIGIDSIEALWEIPFLLLFGKLYTYIYILYIVYVVYCRSIHFLDTYWGVEHDWGMGAAWFTDQNGQQIRALPWILSARDNLATYHIIYLPSGCSNRKVALDFLHLALKMPWMFQNVLRQIQRWINTLYHQVMIMYIYMLINIDIYIYIY